MSDKVHRDLKLENILLSKKEENIENICIKVCRSRCISFVTLQG